MGYDGNNCNNYIYMTIAVAGIWVMSVLLIDLRSDFFVFHDVLLRFTLFDLYTLTFVMLNCLLVLFTVEFEWPKRQIFILCIYYE